MLTLIVVLAAVGFAACNSGGVDQEEPTSFTVSFESNGGNVVAAITVDKDTLITSLPTPTRDGYTFAGWYKNASLTTAWNLTTDTVTGDVTLYAKWEAEEVPVQKAVVSFESNGGNAIASVTVDKGSKLSSLPTPTRAGYDFIGWYKNASLTTAWNLTTDTVTSDITLYAKWEAEQVPPVQTAVVSFESNGGNAIASVTVDKGSKLSSLPTPTRGGYDFIGWYKNASLTTAWNLTTDTVTSDIILYAKWEAEQVPPVQTAVVSFESNGGNAIASVTVNKGSKLSSLPTPTRGGYDFIGWYKEASLTTAWNRASDTVTIDITLYAKWEEIPKYTVTFNFNNGGPVDHETVERGSKLTAPIVPPLEGWTFLRWYKEANFINAWNFAVDTVTGDITLYAKWERSGTTGLIYALNGSTSYSVTGYNGSAAEVRIPAEHNGLPVTAIAANAFQSKTAITAIIIPYSITSIGSNVFADCTVLTNIEYNAENVSGLVMGGDIFYKAGKSGNGISVVFGESVKSIPAYLFHVTSSSFSPKIVSVDIGGSVTSIGDYAFYYASSLASIVISDNVQSIGEAAFAYCDGLTSLVIGLGVKSISEQAFACCYALTYIEFNAESMDDLYTGNTILVPFKIPNEIFYNAGVLRNGISVVFGESVKSIPAYLFHVNSSISRSFNPKIVSVDIGGSVTSIGDYAFSNCSGLTGALVIPNGVTSIGQWAFTNCEYITSLVIGENVTSIGECAFANCAGLTSLEYNAKSVGDLPAESSIFSDAGKNGSGINLVFGENVNKIPNCLFYGRFGNKTYISKITGEVVIPNSVKSIGGSSFANCADITRLIIGTGLTSIGTYAFAACTKLTYIEYNAENVSDLTPDSSDIFYDAGVNGSGISVVFGDSVKKIPAGLFYVSGSGNKAKITSVTIGTGVTHIGDGAFSTCTSLTSVTINSSIPPTLGGSDVFYGTPATLKIYVPATAVTTYKNNSSWSAYSGKISAIV
jgi:uncharacterized repeat protein (TIGR02543 family)